MHWLTWQEIADLFRTWQGFGLALIGAVSALYNAPRSILETWDWYMNRFYDEEVLDLYKEQALLPRELRPKPVESLGVQELATKLKRTPGSIYRSNKRLKRKRLIEYYRGGFRFKE